MKGDAYGIIRYVSLMGNIQPSSAMTLKVFLLLFFATYKSPEINALINSQCNLTVYQFNIINLVCQYILRIISFINDIERRSDNAKTQRNNRSVFLRFVLRYNRIPIYSLLAERRQRFNKIIIHMKSILNIISASIAGLPLFSYSLHKSFINEKSIYLSILLNI